MHIQPISPGTCIVRNTASRKGRTIVDIFTPLREDFLAPKPPV